MITLQLDMYQACALGALVYCLGRLMVNKLSFLRQVLHPGTGCRRYRICAGSSGIICSRDPGTFL